jgi:hypothetical protein
MAFIPGTTRSTIKTFNELDLLYLGEFPSDPASDVGYHIAHYFNYNMEFLDTVVSRVNVIEQKVEVIEESGLSSKFLYGGTF